ncbi:MULTISPECIES: hypothetical protein [unclassified Microbacterium]|uniref:hypothetical protein n=1 Tax=unclassified Microbacterium TaxID=2609290 RepID=UPI003FA60FA0
MTPDSSGWRSASRAARENSAASATNPEYTLDTIDYEHHSESSRRAVSSSVTGSRRRYRVTARALQCAGP